MVCSPVLTLIIYLFILIKQFDYFDYCLGGGGGEACGPLSPESGCCTDGTVPFLLDFMREHRE